MNKEIYCKITTLLERSGIVKPVAFHLEDSEMILGSPTGIFVYKNIKIYVTIFAEQKERIISIPINQIRSIVDC